MLYIHSNPQGTEMFTTGLFHCLKWNLLTCELRGAYDLLPTHFLSGDCDWSPSMGIEGCRWLVLNNRLLGCSVGQMWLDTLRLMLALTAAVVSRQLLKCLCRLLTVHNVVRTLQKHDTPVPGRRRHLSPLVLLGRP